MPAAPTADTCCGGIFLRCFLFEICKKITTVNRANLFTFLNLS